MTRGRGVGDARAVAGAVVPARPGSTATARLRLHPAPPLCHHMTHLRIRWGGRTAHSGWRLGRRRIHRRRRAAVAVAGRRAGGRRRCDHDHHAECRQGQREAPRAPAGRWHAGVPRRRVGEATAGQTLRGAIDERLSGVSGPLGGRGGVPAAGCARATRPRLHSPPSLTMLRHAAARLVRPPVWATASRGFAAAAEQQARGGGGGGAVGARAGAGRGRRARSRVGVDRAVGLRRRTGQRVPAPRGPRRNPLTLRAPTARRARARGAAPAPL